MGLFTEHLAELGELSYTERPLTIPPELEVSEDMATAPERIAKLEERADWHRNIGWGLATIYAFVAIGFLTWYLPKELETSRQQIKADTAQQLEPINNTLARLTALIEVKQNKDVSQALGQSLGNTQNPALLVKTVSAITQAAKDEHLLVQPKILLTANDTLREIGIEHEDLKSESWNARVNLLDYRSSMNLASYQNPPSPNPAFSINLSMQDMAIEGATIPLDNTYWRNIVFKNATIEYNGGPMALENVVFVNCNFRVKQNTKTDEFTGTLLAENSVTKSFQ